MFTVVFKYPLLTGAKLNAQDNTGSTALMYAVQNGRLENVCRLLKHGADINLPTTKGCTPLLGMEHILLQSNNCCMRNLSLKLLCFTWKFKWKNARKTNQKIRKLSFSMSQGNHTLDKTGNKHLVHCVCDCNVNLA